MFEDDENPWRHRAACLDHDPDLWYPQSGEIDTTEVAKRICAYCPVVDECRTHARKTAEPYGIWGGESAKQRAAVLNSTARARTQAG